MSLKLGSVGGSDCGLVKDSKNVTQARNNPLPPPPTSAGGWHRVKDKKKSLYLVTLIAWRRLGVFILALITVDDDHDWYRQDNSNH